MALAAPLPSAEDVYEALKGHEPDGINKWISAIAAEQEADGNAKLANEFRKQCERLIGFTEYRYSRYVTAPHHALVAAHLEQVERREIDRLIIEMPPRHGKSGPMVR